MANFDGVALLAPVAGEKIGNEAAMAFLWAGFGAEKRDLGRPRRRIETCGDTTLFHHCEKICFIGGPIFRAAIRLEKFRWRGEQRLMQVFHSGDFSQKEGEVGMLGESRELAAAILTDVDDLLDPGTGEQSEEFLGGFSGEADGAEETLHHIQKYSAASGEARNAKSLDWRTRASFRAASRPETNSEVLVTSSKPWRTRRRSSASR